jgi:hypothetical protein
VLKTAKASSTADHGTVLLKNNVASITPNIDDWDMIIIRGLQQDTRFEDPKGSPYLGQELRIEISCDPARPPLHVTFAEKYLDGNGAFMARFPTTICEPASDGLIPDVTYTLRYDEVKLQWKLVAVNYESLALRDIRRR